LLSDIAANKDNFFSCLPDELLVKIFRQLSTSDLLKRVALVSTEFYRLTKSPLVHLNVDLKLINFDDEQPLRKKIGGFLSKAVNMRQLVVTTPDFLDLGPEEQNEHNTHYCFNNLLLATRGTEHKDLKSITVDSLFFITSSCFAWLEKTVWLKNLERLEIRVEDPEKYVDGVANPPLDGDDYLIAEMDPNFNTKEGFDRVFDILQKSEKMRHFHAIGWDSFRNDSVANENCFKQISSITLCASDDNFTLKPGDPIKTILEARKNHLEDLTITKLKEYEGAVSDCVMLKSLKLEICNFPLRKFEINLFKTLSNLTSLEVNMFGADFDIKRDLFPPKNLPHLKSLNLTGSNSFLLNYFDPGVCVRRFLAKTFCLFKSCI
jgi:hypothetical protein